MVRFTPLAIFISLTLYAIPQGLRPPLTPFRFGVAGCGAITLFIQNTTKPFEIAKSMSAYLGLGTINVSAMSTGTSNCTANPTASAEFPPGRIFLAENYSEISKEAAQGSGEHVGVLAMLLDYEPIAFRIALKAQYVALFSGDPDTTWEKIVGSWREMKMVARKRAPHFHPARD